MSSSLWPAVIFIGPALRDLTWLRSGPMRNPESCWNKLIIVFSQCPFILTWGFEMLLLWKQKNAWIISIILTIFIFLMGALVLAEPEQKDALKELIRRIELRINGLKGLFAHLKNFTTAKEGSDLVISYKNNVQHLPNPDYDYLMAELKKKREEQPQRKLHGPSETIKTYSETDGIEILIELIDRTKYSGAGLLIPYATLGSHSLIVEISGAKTDSFKNLKATICRIIDEEITHYKKTEKDPAP